MWKCCMCHSSAVLNRVYFNVNFIKKCRRQAKVKWPGVLLLREKANAGCQVSLKSPTKETQLRTRLFLGFWAMIPARLCFLPKRRCQRSLYPPPLHTSARFCFQHLHHWELSATVDYIMASILLLAKKRKTTHHKIEQTEDRDGGAEGKAWNKERRAHVWPWMTPEVVFAWKTAFHSLCLSLCLYSLHSLACCVQSEWFFTCLQPGGKTELQSQAAKWWKTQASRDALSQDRELRARENARFST